MLDAEKIFTSSKGAGELEIEGICDIIPVDSRGGDLGSNLVDLGPLSRSVISSSSVWRLRDVDENWTEMLILVRKALVRIGDH